MDIDIFGGWEKHPSQDINNRTITNWFTMETGDGGRGSKVLMPRAGLLPVISSDVGAVTVFNFDDRLYFAAGRNLYSMTLDMPAGTGTATLVGTLRAPVYRFQAAYNNLYAMFNNGDVLTFATNTLTHISDIDFAGAQTVTYMDGYFIYNEPGTSTVYASALNDPFTWTALDFANAEGAPDKLLAVIADKRELLMFGKRSVEVWADTANPLGFPFTRQDGAFINQGISAAFSLIQIDNTVVFLDDRRYVVALQGYDLVVLSSTSIKNEFASYADVSDAYAYQLQERGHLFYIIVFPSADATWAFDMNTKLWHKRTFRTDGNLEERDRVHSCVKYDNYFIAGDRENGKVYLYTSSCYTDNGKPIRRSLKSPFYSDGFNYIGVSYVEMYGEFGKAPQTGQGSEPLLMLRYSNDGGYTWSNELTASLGAVGNYNKRLVFRALGTELEWQFELSFSESIPHSISQVSAQFDSGN